MEHLKKNYPIYLVLLIFLIITLLVVFNYNNNINNYDVSGFKNIDIKKVNELFKKDNISYLFIGRQGCSASKEFSNSAMIAQGRFGVNIYYYELSEEDIQSSEGKVLIDNLDIEYNMNDEVKSFGEYIGSTPMFVVIKNKKMVYGYIGNRDSDFIGSVIDKYGK